MNILNPQAKLLHHGCRVEQWLKGGNPAPVLVEIAPTAYCNASCPWCFFSDRWSGKHINTTAMITVLKDLREAGVKAVNWTGGGEPTLHPSFYSFVEIAASIGLEQGLFTNAYNKIKHPELFTWIRVSMTDKGIEAINPPETNFGVCVNMTPDMDDDLLRRWCIETKGIGASYFQVRPALVGDYRKQPELDSPYYLMEYESDGFSVMLTPYKFAEATKPRGYDKCYGYQFCPSIDWDGNLGVCLYRMDEGKYVLGNLNTTTFSIIWAHRVDRPDLVDDSCQNCCKNHEINKILFCAKTCGHIDFL